MKRNFGVRGVSLLLALVLLMVGTEAAQAPTGEAGLPGSALPLWAYPVGGIVPSVVPGTTAPVQEPLEHVPGSSAGYTKAQIADLFTAPDWFPATHPAMPAAVAEGRKPVLFACAHCHLPNGLGRPENESIAGLPVAYIEEQVADFKNDLRHSSDPGMPVANMIRVAKAASPEEIEQRRSIIRP